MSLPCFKRYAPWCSQVTAAASLIIVVYIKSKFIFESGTDAGLLKFMATVAAALTLILALLSLPRWQGIVALAIFAYVGYQLLFVSLYQVP